MLVGKVNGSVTAIMDALIQLRDDPARRLFKQARNERMYQRRTSCSKEGNRETQRKEHMLSESLIDRCWMGKKNTLEHGTS